MTKEEIEAWAKTALKDAPITMEADEDAGTGQITTEWTFWCGLCSTWEQIGTENRRAGAIRQARRQGWRLTKANGWVCPRHKEKT